MEARHSGRSRRASRVIGWESNGQRFRQCIVHKNRCSNRNC